MTDQLIFKSVSPYNENVQQMIRLLDQYQSELYPAESNHLDSLETLSGANCKLIGAFFDNPLSGGDQLVGIGAAKIIDSYGELKRFYVPKEYRGRGIAEGILQALEIWLVEQKTYLSRLETGIHQKAAIRFYQKLGYNTTKPFGNYKVDPLSVFMEKTLT